MNAVELIRKKRNGNELTEKELDFLISTYVDGVLPDYQMSSFLMACYFRGMSDAETRTFTSLMLHSGTLIDLSDIPGFKIDKHSTGGVGDKVSLILAPIVAACGVPVPMISGRGLGHTGGTLDKLESIPGFRTNLSVEEYRKVIKEIGVVMIGQTNEIVPADKKMYALRDVTATVECIPLIAGSIMSKKLAEGIDALVLDIKTGRGAFMQEYEKSIELAKTLVAIGNQFGKETIGFITEMGQPLGIAIGNWLEVVESIECLKGERGTDDSSSDLMEVTHTLAGAMLMLGKKVNTIQEGSDLSKETITSGKAYEKFKELVRIQGGDVSAIENLKNYPISAHSIDVKSPANGFVTSIDALELGLTSVMLGAGREKVNDPVDPKAGILLKKKIGDQVEAGEIVAQFFTDREEEIEKAKNRIRKSFVIDSKKPAVPKLVKDIVDRDGVRPWE